MNKPLFKRAAALVGCVLALSACPGCVSDAPTGSRAARRVTPRGGIEEINVLAIPVGLNLDEKPGLDGFVIKIYASNRTRPKPMLLEEGTIDVLMFDGIPGITTDRSALALRVWNYTAKEMEQFETRTSIGMSYQLALTWGEAKPASNKISILVRYTPPGGVPITSQPSIISIALK